MPRLRPVAWCSWTHYVLKSVTAAELSTSEAYMAIGADLDGIKHIVGLRIAKEEGASLWAQVCANLFNRGVKDVFIVCCDG